MAQFWAYASVELTGLLIFTLMLLRHYTHDSVRWGYWVIIAMSWYLGFVGTLLLPMDIGQSQTEGPQPVMETLWLFTYWTTFVLAWVVLPVLQEFYGSGELGWKARLKYSLKSNVKFYLVCLVLIVALIIWMAVSAKWSIEHVGNFLIIAANTWGIILTVFMLGYGLVEVPRMFWAWSDPTEYIRVLQFSAPHLDSDLFAAQCDMGDIIADTKRLRAGLPRTGELRDFIESIHRGLPTDVGSGASAGDATTDVETATVADLAALHRKLIAGRARLKRCQFRWQRLLKRVSEAELIAANTQPVVHTRKEKLQWWWRLKASRVAYKTASVICAALSGMVVWCELAVALPTDINLSVYGLIVEGAQGWFGKQLLCIIPLAYMSVCLYLPLFRLKLFDSMEMVGNRQTDTYSLCFNASYLCRLQFVLAYNFQRLLKTQQTTFNTAFDATVGGNITVLDDFNTYVPLIMILLSLLTFFNVYTRVMRLMGIEQFGTPRKGNEDDQETIDEGRNLIDRAQNRDLERGRRGAAAAAAGTRTGRTGRYTPPALKEAPGGAGGRGGEGRGFASGRGGSRGYSQLK